MLTFSTFAWNAAHALAPLRVVAMAWSTAVIGRAPKREFYVQHPALMWAGIVSDVLVAGAFVALFICLVWIAIRLKDLRGFRSNMGVILAFELLMLTCAAYRMLGTASVWWVLTPVAVVIKLLCAAAALPAAVLFLRAAPALVANVASFVEVASATEWQRDEAVTRLNRWELVIEERQKAAKEIANAYGQLSATLEYTSDMVLNVGREWKILYANRKALENVPDLKIGEDYWKCFPEALGTITEEKLREVMANREATRYENFYTPYARWYRVQVFPTDEGLSVFFSDVTEDHQLREQLELEQMLREKRIEALSHMAGGLAHEISNPLAIIHAKASDLVSSATMETSFSASAVLEVCNSIVNTSERAMAILRGLRGFAREASNDPMEWASMDTIVEQCLEMQEARYERHNIALRASLEPELPLLLCREIQIGQIVTNLLNNAFDAIEQAACEERWVELTVTCGGNKVTLEVTDSGPGVDEHFKAHLMEPFFTTKKGGNGMGVGLSLSRAIAHDHGGTLELRSGTRHTSFRLVLPAASGSSAEIDSVSGEAREERLIPHAT